MRPGAPTAAAGDLSMTDEGSILLSRKSEGGRMGEYVAASIKKEAALVGPRLCRGSGKEYLDLCRT